MLSSYLYISRAKLVANFNRSFLASLLIVEFEIIVLLKLFPTLAVREWILAISRKKKTHTSSGVERLHHLTRTFQSNGETKSNRISHCLDCSWMNWQWVSNLSKQFVLGQFLAKSCYYQRVLHIVVGCRKCSKCKLNLITNCTTGGPARRSWTFHDGWAQFSARFLVCVLLAFSHLLSVLSSRSEWLCSYQFAALTLHTPHASVKFWPYFFQYMRNPPDLRFLFPSMSLLW